MDGQIKVTPKELLVGDEVVAVEGKYAEDFVEILPFHVLQIKDKADWQDGLTMRYVCFVETEEGRDYESLPFLLGSDDPELGDQGIEFWVIRP